MAGSVWNWKTDTFEDPVIEIKHSYWGGSDEGSGTAKGSITIKNKTANPIYNVKIILDVDDDSATWDVWLCQPGGAKIESPQTLTFGTIQSNNTTPAQNYWWEVHHIGGPVGGPWHANFRLIPEYEVHYDGSNAFTSTSDITSSGS
ncbi:MAG: hypothetical protein J7647_08155 [Cyanobacteria bacterium SBLK]|nr:hypothetical protein [Cyanobacteria bacterium SBLK]